MAHILLVEDKASVRFTIQAVLEDNGFTVEALEDGAQASSYMENPSIIPDLIISDIIMPKVTGVEFISGLRVMNCNVPVLLISGGGYDMSAADLLETAEDLADAILKKPFVNDDLIQIANQLTGKKRLG